MSLIKRSEWPSLGGSLLSNFFDDDRFFSSPWLRGTEMPAVNIKEHEKDFEVELAAPGYKREDFDLSIDNGLLTISAKRKEENEHKEDQYTRREFGYSSFTRSFQLPDHVDQENIQAKYEDGVLRLLLQKNEKAKLKKAKTIQIT